MRRSVVGDAGPTAGDSCCWASSGVLSTGARKAWVASTVVPPSRSVIPTTRPIRLRISLMARVGVSLSGNTTRT